jgi:hypothetical protein
VPVLGVKSNDENWHYRSLSGMTGRIAFGERGRP